MRLRAVVATCAWTLLFLAALDVAVGFAFPMPSDPQQQPGRIAQYFGYGQSVEAKLARMIKPTDEASAPIIVAGWIDRECAEVPPSPPPGKLGITVYGMSFSDHIVGQLEQMDTGLAPIGYSGPGAPLNHSYACFQSVNAAGEDPNRVQIIGVLASSVQRMLTIGGLTTSFEAPAPFSYPRYRLNNGKLAVEEPVLRGTAGLRDPKVWEAYRAQLADYDALYDPFLFEGGPFDRSVFINMLRRAYAQAEERRVTKSLVNDGTDFLPNPDVGPVMEAMLLDFAKTVRAQGKLPMVILFQDQGLGTDSLYRLIGPALERAGVPLIRSDKIAPVTDSANFIADGHFTPEVDRKIAEAVLAEIRRNLSVQPAH